MLAYLHSALCPLFYAFNLKDFQAARQMFLKKHDNELSLSSKMSKSQNNMDDLEKSFYSSDEEEEEEEKDEDGDGDDNNEEFEVVSQINDQEL